jgi:hypothetical protein
MYFYNLDDAIMFVALSKHHYSYTNFIDLKNHIKFRITRGDNGGSFLVSECNNITQQEAFDMVEKRSGGVFTELINTSALALSDILLKRNYNEETTKKLLHVQSIAALVNKVNTPPSKVFRYTSKG